MNRMKMAVTHKKRDWLLSFTLTHWTYFTRTTTYLNYSYINVKEYVCGSVCERHRVHSSEVWQFGKTQKSQRGRGREQRESIKKTIFKNNSLYVLCTYFVLSEHLLYKPWQLGWAPFIQAKLLLMLLTWQCTQPLGASTSMKSLCLHRWRHNLKSTFDCQGSWHSRSQWSLQLWSDDFWFPEDSQLIEL